jgi:hypothetical protein
LSAFYAINYLVLAQGLTDQTVIRQKSGPTSSKTPTQIALAKPAAPAAVATSRINQTRSFALYDELGRQTKSLPANLKAAGKYSDVWVDNAETIPAPLLTKLVNQIDNKIYPVDARNFATAACRKKVPRIAVLITDTNNLDGYFDSRDVEGQNHLNLIYLNSRLVKNNMPEAFNTITHEFEHLLFYRSGGADIEWLDEGMAVYSEYMNGNFPSLYVNEYYNQPNVRLAGPFLNENNYYGAAFTFVSFAVDQVQKSHKSVPQFFQELINRSNSGTTGINVVLHRFIENKQLDSYGEIYRTTQLRRYAASIIP